MTPEEREPILEKEASPCPMAPHPGFQAPGVGTHLGSVQRLPQQRIPGSFPPPPPSPPAFPGLWVCPGSTFRGFLPLSSTGHRHPPPCDTCRPRTPLRSCATGSSLPPSGSIHSCTCPGRQISPVSCGETAPPRAPACLLPHGALTSPPPAGLGSLWTGPRGISAARGGGGGRTEGTRRT